MTDFLFQMGLSNACFALALAIVAMVVGARAKRPHLAHMLWLLVFVKLVTPPVVTIPVGMPSLIASNDDLPAEMNLPVVSELDVETQPATALASQAPSLLSNIGTRLNAAKPLLASIWLLGSLFIFAWSVRRVFQFTRLLQENTEPAPHQLQTAAATIAKQLELNALPVILTTSARLSPMVWWTGGKVRVVIPSSLLHEMDASEWRWVLAHELAHVRRRDYLVRWLEWLACVGFWWNPVVWWAQRNLRRTEEICCDALVLSCLKPKPRSYANSLLAAVESFASPALRPPAMASEINSGGFLERRFRMIVSETPNRVSSRWLQACVLLCAVVVLPLGMAYAQDYEAVGRRLRAAVEAGELTGEQARAMLGTLKKMAKKTGDKDELNAYFQQVWARLQAAVKEGKMSAEDAEAKMTAIKKAKLGAGTKEIDYKAIGEKIRAAVKAGKLTEEEARAKWAAIKKQADRGSKRITREDLARAGIEIRKAVAAGKLSEEDGRAKMAAMRKMMGEQSEGAAKKGTDWEGIKKRIEGAVKSGDLTRQEADAKYKEIRKRMAGRRQR